MDVKAWKEGGIKMCVKERKAFFDRERMINMSYVTVCRNLVVKVSRQHTRGLVLECQRSELDSKKFVYYLFSNHFFHAEEIQQSFWSFCFMPIPLQLSLTNGW